MEETSREKERLEPKKGVPGDVPDVQKPVRDTVFYYSRERRLARASQAVRDLYDVSPASRPTLFKALTGGNRAGAIVLITIVVVSFASMILSRGLRESGGTKLGENRIDVSALSFPARENETPDTSNESAVTYIAFTKKANSEKAYTGTVDIAVSIYQKDTSAGEDAPISTHRVFFTIEPEEDFRFSVPFTGPELIMVFRAEDELATLRVKPE
jgi:hypothetical protein